MGMKVEATTATRDASGYEWETKEVWATNLSGVWLHEMPTVTVREY